MKVEEGVPLHSVHKSFIKDMGAFCIRDQGHEK